MFKISNSRLIRICEGLTSVYKVSGLNIGDQVKIDKAAFTHDAFKALPKEIQAKFKEMVDAEEAGDVIISVSGINRSPVDPSLTNTATIEIGINGGGNMFYDVISIPYELVQFVNKISDGINMPAIVAPNAKVTYENDPSVTELTADDLKGKDPNMGPEEEPVRELPKTNTVLPSSKPPVEQFNTDKIKRKIDLAPGVKA